MDPLYGVPSRFPPFVCACVRAFVLLFTYDLFCCVAVKHLVKIVKSANKHIKPCLVCRYFCININLKEWRLHQFLYSRASDDIWHVYLRCSCCCCVLHSVVKVNKRDGTLSLLYYIALALTTKTFRWHFAWVCIFEMKISPCQRMQWVDKICL